MLPDGCDRLLLWHGERVVSVRDPLSPHILVLPVKARREGGGRGRCMNLPAIKN